MSFITLNLHPLLLKSLQQLKHTEATPIQQQAIPRVLAGKDIIATAQTGTGKTAAYLLPLLQRFIEQPRRQNAPRALVLVPTRELAFQVKDAVMSYGHHVRPRVASILGGMPYHAQLRQLSQPLDIIVATPGRLIDYLNQKPKRLDLSAIEVLVLDEADRMLDMGFFDDVQEIVRATPAKRQTLLFTATMDKQLANLANTILRNPERIEVVGKKITLENIEQRLHIADDEKHKSRLLTHLLTNESIYKAIIFSATKRGADELARQLRAQGHQAGALHGDMKQNHRNRTLDQLRRGRISLLVATDVAARGIDISDISHVINYDLPKFAEDYVHRIGRTGRAGRTGIAISLVSASEGRALQRIERFTQHRMQQQQIPGLESRRSLRSAPSGSNGKPPQRHKKKFQPAAKFQPRGRFAKNQHPRERERAR